MKRTLLVLLAALALIVVISACAAPTEAPKPTVAPAQPTAAPKPTAAPAATSAPAVPPTSALVIAPTPTSVKATPVPVPAGATKFDFWHAMTAPNGDYITEMAGRYNASQTKCYVNATFQGVYDDELNKLKAGMQSKDVPALVQMYDLGTQLMIDLKATEPMQTFIDKDKYDLSAYEPTVLGYYTVGGKLYSMPFNTSAPIMYYNKTMFKAAGLDPEKPPRTYAEVIDAAKKLTKKDASGKVIVYGYGISIYGWIFEQLNAAAGGLYLNNDNGRASRATAAAFNGPEGVAAIQFWKDGYDTGAFANLGRAPAGNDAVVAAFASQQVAMFVESTARLRAEINAAVSGNFEMGTAYIPRPNEDAFKKSGVIIGGASLHILKDRPAAEQACAWDFVKYVTSPDIQAYWHTSSGYYPITKKAYDVPLDKEWVGKYPQFLTAINQLHDAPAIPATAGGVGGTMPQNRQRIEQAIEEVLAGKSTAKQALDAAATDVNKYISDYNKTVQ